MRQVRRYLLAAAGLVVVVAALAGLKGAQISEAMAAGKRAQKAGPPPEAVNTARAERVTWDETLQSIGSVAPARGVTIGNDSAGIVARILFESGASVRANDALVELDTRVERAQTASARARNDLARLNVERSRNLRLLGTIPQQQLDTDEATFASTMADEHALLAQVERKVIRAPFAGKLGIRLVNIGQFLPSGSPVTVIESNEPGYVDFTLPQQDTALVSVGMPVRMTVAEDKTRSSEGTVITVEPTVDATTRNIKLRASLPATDTWIRPGMFVDVTVVRPEKATVIVVPATAVVHASFGDSVFVVESGVARQQFVKVGSMRGDFVSIASGLEAGQEVVTAGAFKLRNGTRINVRNEVQVEPQIAPHPVNR